jgi:prophage antirepressor-like protein
MSDLIEIIDNSFNFNNETVRIIGSFEEPWFIAKDVCSILGLSNVTEAIRHIPEKWRSSEILSTTSGNQNTNIINEAGLYRLIMRSNKKVAQKFQEWVCGEVLPSLRKKGEYKMKEEYQLKLKELEDEKLEKDKQIKKLQNQVLQKQKRTVYSDKNCIYMIQDEFHKKNRTYIIGKAIDLTQRLTTYNKSRDFEVIYNRNCNSAQQMNIIEKCVLSKLDKYREVSNRDRFILPEDKDDSLFKNAIDLFINAFEDVDPCVDIEKDLTEDEIMIKDLEKRREFREDNKETLDEKIREYK